MKRCHKCGEIKPHDGFSMAVKNWDGKQNACKDCCKLYKTVDHSSRQLEREELHKKGMRRCNGCDEIKPLEDFTYRSDTYDNRDTRCHKCKGVLSPYGPNESARKLKSARRIMKGLGKSEIARLFDEITALIEYDTPLDHDEDDVNTLYRFFDESGVLLYVGITYNPPSRFRSHESTKQWWSQVRTIELEQYISRDAVLFAEREAIRHEQPLFNVKHNT